MSLTESPLHLILIPSVEVGLNRGDRLGILFPSSCFVFDVHSEQSTSVGAVKGGVWEPREKPGWFIGSLYLRKVPCRPIECRDLQLFASSGKCLRR